ncbi:MAG: metal-dependent hydrolase, partial [Acidobacteriota bacterium]|nr:metal-dependent hydrolase [Acidobacteriota bacterium]
MESDRMEPVTHFLAGACIGRTGLNRKTVLATLAAVLAAEAADLDVFWGFAGPVEELKHHRGFTHALIGAPVVAAVVTGAVWGFHIWRERRRARKLAKLNTEPGAPIPPKLAPRKLHLGWLYLTTLIAALSHILLDWTNNYGVRPFFPFNPKWYAGSLVFIVEPVLLVLFAAALIFPAIFGLTDREIGARSKGPRGQIWAIFALTGMVLLWILRATTHAEALAMLKAQPITAQPVIRVAAEPYPINPFRWHAIIETPRFYQTAEIDTRTDRIDTDPEQDVIYKPTDTPAVETAKRTELGRVYLDWGRWAVVRDIGQYPVPGVAPPDLPPGRTWTTVEFTDLRFGYGFGGFRSASGPPPLSAFVYIVDGHEDAG